MEPQSFCRHAIAVLYWSTLPQAQGARALTGSGYPRDIAKSNSPHPMYGTRSLRRSAEKCERHWKKCIGGTRLFHAASSQRLIQTTPCNCNLLISEEDARVFTYCFNWPLS